MRHLISIFGVAQQGDFYRHIPLKSLDELLLTLGHSTEGSIAIELAIQALMHKRPILFYRIKEEGFENDAYFKGIEELKKRDVKAPLSALALPGVGSQEVIHEATLFCKKGSSILIMNTQDFYDYITQKNL